MKRPFVFMSIATLLLGMGFLIIQAQPAHAVNATLQQVARLIRGAQLYDDWTQLSATPPPAGNHPIWDRQTTNTRAGIDTWRCASCHGWDYEGKDGAFGSGANYTGFPGVYDAQSQSLERLQQVLSGSNDSEHDFTPYLSSADLAALSTFIRDGVIDDSRFIDPLTLKPIGGDLDHGKTLYDQGCASCHGEDGQKIAFRYEGQTVTLGTLAIQDPWRFLHRTRFGTARAPEMTIGLNLGWSPQDGRDVLLFSQTFPTGGERPLEPSLAGQQPAPPVQPGGPASNFFTGILTAFGAMATSLGFALVLGGLLVGILLLVVWSIRNRN
ncbi:MAG: c-type cytochrome [Bellilinea sp.]|jgi:thiosulfate dehydrogenase